MVKTVYQAEDGEYFDNHAEAVQYEIKKRYEDSILNSLDWGPLDRSGHVILGRILAKPRVIAELLRLAAEDLGIPELPK